MAENKENKAKSQEIKTESVSKLEIVGPKDATNGASVLRFNRDRNRKAIDLVPGQILTVGDDGDITQDEAKNLLSYDRWEIKEVNK